MFTKVKTVRLTEEGYEKAEWHDAESISLAEIVAAIDAQYPNSLIEARYVK